jgi:hypothetical protein
MKRNVSLCCCCCCCCKGTAGCSPLCCRMHCQQKVCSSLYAYNVQYVTMLNPAMEVFQVVVAGQNEAVASFSLHHMDWTVHMAYPECKGLGISDFKPKGAFQSNFVFRQSWFYKFELSCFFSIVFSLIKPIEHSPSLLVLPHFPLKPFWSLSTLPQFK